MVTQFVFYMFGTLAVITALMVVSVRNPVHSALLLALTFFNMAGIFLLLGAEFLAVILVMVYMGAVAILFLFVVMMLDVDITAMRKGMINHLPAGLFVGGVLLVEILAVVAGFHIENGNVAAVAGVDVNNTMELGKLLYTKYLFPFEIASLILLVALVGAVVLTLRSRTDKRRQVITKQIARTVEESMEIKKVATGQGA